MFYSDADAANPVVNVDTPQDVREKFVLTDEEITLLARWALLIEQHYKMPMDFEWTKDGLTGEISIVQACPETIYSRQPKSVKTKEYTLKESGKVLTSGKGVGKQITSSVARLLSSPKYAHLTL